MATIDLKHITRLARIKLTRQERQNYLHQITSILGYVDQIQQVDTSSIKPTFQTTATKTVTRADRVKSSLSQSSALTNAAVTQNGYIVVPQTIKK